jgi:hypothetical protein
MKVIVVVHIVHDGEKKPVRSERREYDFSRPERAIRFFHAKLADQKKAAGE